MQNILSLSIPRSGHHLFVKILENYFSKFEFSHCETYEVIDCCNKSPCTSVLKKNISSSRFYEYENHLKLFIKKSHDLKNEISISDNFFRIVQLREPLQSAIANLRWEVQHFNSLQLNEFGLIINKFILYYIIFYNKWCTEGGKFLLTFEELTSSPDSIYQNVSRFLSIMNLEIDEVRLNDSISISTSKDSHTNIERNFSPSNYSESLYFSMSGFLTHFLLSKLPILCPSIISHYPNRHDIQPQDLEIEESYNKLFYILDFSSDCNINIDLTTDYRTLDKQTLLVKEGLRYFIPLGFSQPEYKNGMWTDSDIFILPCRFNSDYDSYSIKLSCWALYPYELISKTRLFFNAINYYEELPFNSKVDQNFLEINIDTSFIKSNLIDLKDGCFIFKIYNHVYYDSNDSRKLGFLFKNIEGRSHNNNEK
jgi:hypothetical protein